jgi:putative FmdB family regulatory protein
MPTYEYVCEKCGHNFEKVQSIKDPALTTCPKELCKLKKWGKGKVKRAMSAGAGLIFKGSGFYITDYRSENYKAGAKKESTASKPAETKSTGSADKSPKKETTPTPKPSSGKKD